ncbi:hypothetical protein OIE69_40960 [Actinacidiphila glaucinigra]|uniref:hypothetical protein n=1 Tax=Actinacidiphila glaucinigra TaxID=235986 RepID=UPI002DD82931|nr:hypothetical protein [Actinacidiphila glaucinigra]WSD64817.1 hypothetical protein OIE69_40960 [Actinacidiphila glaucinigra]
MTAPVAGSSDPSAICSANQQAKRQSDPPVLRVGVRDAEHPYGFAEFAVDPGRHPGDMTRIHVTYYNIITPTGELSVFEKFTLQRRRSDGGHSHH